MIKSAKLLVVDKTDIHRQPQNAEKPVTDWVYSDLRQKSHELLQTSEMVIGIDVDGNTIVIKNRWGKSGVVVSHDDYNKFIRPKYENSKSGNTSKEKHILGRIFSFDFWPFN